MVFIMCVCVCVCVCEQAYQCFFYAKVFNDCVTIFRCNKLSWFSYRLNQNIFSNVIEDIDKLSDEDIEEMLTNFNDVTNK